MENYNINDYYVRIIQLPPGYVGKLILNNCKIWKITQNHVFLDGELFNGLHWGKKIHKNDIHDFLSNYKKVIK